MTSFLIGVERLFPPLVLSVYRSPLLSLGAPLFFVKKVRHVIARPLDSYAYLEDLNPSYLSCPRHV